jgi:hypothetical protein
MKRKASLGALLVLAGLSLDAGNPVWWSDSLGGNKVLLENTVAANKAPTNLGQIKNVALRAKHYLDRELASVGGAGSGVNARVGEFYNLNTSQAIFTTATNNKAPANLGQLKHIAKPFYDRLIALGVDTRAMLRSHGAPDWQYYYPWTPDPTDDANKAIANLGQLKWVFCFDPTVASIANPDMLDVDADGDGVMDYIEILANGGRSLGSFTDFSNGSDLQDAANLEKKLTSQGLHGPLIVTPKREVYRVNNPDLTLEHF